MKLCNNIRTQKILLTYLQYGVFFCLDRQFFCIESKNYIMLPLNKGDDNMKRLFKILSFSLLFICTFSFANSAISIKVNNKYIASDATPFIKSGTTYVPIRFVADALDADSVIWNSDTKSVSIKKQNSNILLFVNQNYAYVNSKYKNLANNALLVNDRVFVPIRFVSEILGANVDWDENSRTVSISTKNSNTDDTIAKNPSTNTSSSTSSNKKPTSNTGSSSSNKKPTSNSTSPNQTTSSSNSSSTSPDSQYTDAVYWLSRIIEAEAGGEPFKGKVAVGEVILNRVESEEFPDTIWAVIFDDKFGIQFEPVANGTIYNAPSSDSIKAAQTALNGSNYIGDCLYFLNPTIAESNWIVKNREFYTTIANHDFYA